MNVVVAPHTIPRIKEKQNEKRYYFVCVIAGLIMSLVWGFLFYMVLSLFWKEITFSIAYLIMWLVGLVIGGLTMKKV